MRKPSFHLKSYPWYVSDWRMSEARLRLSPLGRYIYRELIDQCYLDGSIPGDERILSKLVDVPYREFMREWPTVRVSFQQDSAGRYHNQKTDETLTELERWHDQKRSAGKAGGKARAEADAKRSPDERQAFAKPHAEAFAKPSSSSSTSTSTSSSEDPLTPLRPEPVEMTPAIAVASGNGWEEFIGVFLAAGKHLNEQDVVQGLREWLSLEMPEQLAAFRHLKAEAMGTEARFLPFPASFLRKRPWTRVGPERILPMQKRTRVDDAQDEALRIFESRQKEGMF